MATTKSSVPSHLKNAANGSPTEFQERHHGKTQSHVVSSDTIFFIPIRAHTARTWYVGAAAGIPGVDQFAGKGGIWRGLLDSDTDGEAGGGDCDFYSGSSGPA